MSVEVKIPAVFRAHVGGASILESNAGTLRELIEDLAGRYPALGEQLLRDGDQLHRFVNIYLNDEDVRYLDGLETKVSDGDVVAILPAVAGGSR